MKKSLLFLAAAALLIVGCEQEESYPTTEMVIFSATAEPIPYASSNEVYTPEWQTGDLITVEYDGSSYTYKAIGDGSSVSFSPTLLPIPTDGTGELNAWSNITDGIFSIGSEQTEGVLPLYAHLSSVTIVDKHVSLDFKPLTSLLALTIGAQANTSIASVTLEVIDETGVTGSLSVTNLEVDPATGVISTTGSSQRSNTVKLDTGSASLDDDCTVYFSIPNGTVVTGGLQVTITSTNGTNYVKEILTDETVTFDGNCIEAYVSLYAGMTISSYDEFLSFAEDCAAGFGGVTVDLLADIDMQNDEWTPISGFSGTFNGNGHNIYNINVSVDGEYAGVFAHTYGPISDLNFGTKDGSTYDGTSRIELKYNTDAGTVGYAGDIARAGGAVTNVTNFVPVTVSADASCTPAVGGVIGGTLQGPVSGCSNYGEISVLMTTTASNVYAGGIIGYLSAESEYTDAFTVENCHNYATVMSKTAASGYDVVGGIAGKTSTSPLGLTFTNCGNEGEIYIDNTAESGNGAVGGLLGWVEDLEDPGSTFSNCKNSGYVHSNNEGTGSIGGICGFGYRITIKNSSNTAKVAFIQDGGTASGSLYIGGIAGAPETFSTITDCTNSGEVYSDKGQINYIGGVVGYLRKSTMSYCENSGAVNVDMCASAGTLEAIGGVCGMIYNSDTSSPVKVENCTNSGVVTAKVNASGTPIGAAGIVGSCRYGGYITNCTNNANVSIYNAYAAKESYAGGIASRDNNDTPGCEVSGCVNRGDVEATVEGGTSSGMCAGGIWGKNKYNSPVDNCKNFGSITCVTYAGSLSGWNYCAISNSVAGGVVNGTTLTADNFEDYIVGHNDTGGTLENITFGTDE